MMVATQVEGFKRRVLEQVFPRKRKMFVRFLLAEVVKRTPVDTTWARAHWQISLTPIRDPAPQPRGIDKDMIAQMAEQIAAINHSGNYPDDKLVYLCNPVPYIIALEEGHSPQSPPNHMIMGALLDISKRYKGTEFV